MTDIRKTEDLCSVCREKFATTIAEGLPGRLAFVCDSCLETARQNFIWICTRCGAVHIRPKSVVLALLTDPHLKGAYRQCEREQFIQGIDRCIECDPERMTDSVTPGMCIIH